MNKLAENAALISNRDGSRVITVEEFDRMFDDGEDISDFIDPAKTRRADDIIKRVNVDMPIWMMSQLDGRARHLGVTRQALIKMWIAERLETGK